MKRTLCLALLLMLACAGAEGVYYVNPDGGRYYHRERECPSMHGKYYAGLQEITARELSDAYALLRPCPVCTEGEAPDYFAGVRRQEAPAQTVLGEGSYFIGLDAPAGLYQFTAAADFTQPLEIRAWDGESLHRWTGAEGWLQTATLHHEMQLIVPAGVEARFLLAVNECAFDTGTRGIRGLGAGVYPAGEVLLPGLYMVRQEEAAQEPVRILNAAGEEARRFTPAQGAQITLYLAQGHTLVLPQGASLRSFSPQACFQQSGAVEIRQARYLAGSEMPGMRYRIEALPGQTAYYTLLHLNDGRTERVELQPRQPVTLDLQGCSGEVLVELVNCLVTPAEEAQG